MLCGFPFPCTVWMLRGLTRGLLVRRYLNVLVTGLQAHYSKTTEKIDSYFYQQNDLCILRLFEAFLESAPQLTLQFYVIMCTPLAGWLTGWN